MPSSNSDLASFREQALRALYVSPNKVRAQAAAVRLQSALDSFEDVEEIALGRECLALIAEAKSDLRAAIAHREAQLALLGRAVRAASHIDKPRKRTAILRLIAEEQTTALAFLSLVLWSVGRNEDALERLDEMRALCVRRKLKFYGGEIRQEIEHEHQKDKGSHVVQKRVRREFLSHAA